MINKTDQLLIRRFIRWAIRQDMNQAHMAELAGRSRAWATFLINGRIKSLNFDTRNRIKKILGINQ